MVSESLSDKQEFDYNPMEITNLLQEEQSTRSINKQSFQDPHFHWTVWCKFIATTMAVSAMQMIASGDYYNENANNITSGEHHRLVRRSGAEASSEGASDSMTLHETDFVYKTFLIFAGLILVINSLIKALNTKISGIKKKYFIAA